jgi:hypothetical protein
MQVPGDTDQKHQGKKIADGQRKDQGCHMMHYGGTDSQQNPHQREKRHGFSQFFFIKAGPNFYRDFCQELHCYQEFQMNLLQWTTTGY